MRHQWWNLRLYNRLTQNLSLPLRKPTSKIPSFLHFHHCYYSYTPNSSLHSPNSSISLSGLFAEPNSQGFKGFRDDKVLILRDELLRNKDDFECVRRVLCEFGSALFEGCDDRSVFIRLLDHISKFPFLALEVFNWRRKQTDFTVAISAEEYAKGIKVAGEAKDVDFAVELFTEAINNGCKTPITYNALMGAYMLNGLSEKCQSLFQEFKKEHSCSPNIVTYNILISLFGRMMLIDHMETTFKEIYDAGLVPDVYTFNNLIAGYVTAWMWDRMEKTYSMMKKTSVGPDIGTYKLMIRGYAHAGNIKKMEKMYDLLTEHSNQHNVLLIRIMISGYCKSSCPNKIAKIDSFLKLIPELEYSSGLSITLIQLYAREKLLDRMEGTINIAFSNSVVVSSINVMRLIITAYFEHKEVDKLSSFVKRAELAGWRICRSLYHCKMVMYASEGRLEEMENVFEEMEKFYIDSRTKKTLVILCSAYSKWGPQCKLEQLVALMLKLGYNCQWEKFSL